MTQDEIDQLIGTTLTHCTPGMAFVVVVYHEQGPRVLSNIGDPALLQVALNEATEAVIRNARETYAFELTPPT